MKDWEIGRWGDFQFQISDFKFQIEVNDKNVRELENKERKKRTLSFFSEFS